MLSDKVVTTTLPTINLEAAREFYGEKLGLNITNMNKPEDAFVCECGGGTRMYIYERPTPSKADHTQASFAVGDIEKEMEELRSRGVLFEEYDMPGLKTINGIATMGESKSAWFKDPDGNILALTQM